VRGAGSRGDPDFDTLENLQLALENIRAFLAKAKK
jgi:hypothetical protein